ncbi:hypothetical protein DN402_08780 [Streptomyces sp. SW4]|nr:hypothetical protein DN402_08780 [Streptomyces sp. SW4]
MAMLTLSCLAADWPAWTAQQAETMGLLCAQCRFDLRTRVLGGGRLPLLAGVVPPPHRQPAAAQHARGTHHCDKPALRRPLGFRHHPCHHIRPPVPSGIARALPACPVNDTPAGGSPGRRGALRATAAGDARRRVGCFQGVRRR